MQLDTAKMGQTGHEKF